MVRHADKILNEKFDGKVGLSIDGGIQVASWVPILVWITAHPFIKSPRHIRQLTTEYDCPMPTIDAAHQHLLTARAIHQEMEREGQAIFEQLDWSGLVAGVRASAGLSGFSRTKVLVTRQVFFPCY